MKTELTFPAKGNMGFTLIELLVVIATIGILASMAMPAFSKVRASSQKDVCMSNLRQIGAAMQLFAADNNMCYPPQEADKAQFAQYGDYPKWYKVLTPYLQKQTSTKTAKTAWFCPSDARPYAYTNQQCSYGMNVNPSPYGDTDKRLIPLATLDGLPSRIIYCADTGQASYDAGITFWQASKPTKGANLEYRHMGNSRDQMKKYASVQEVKDQGGYGNFLFFDGHVETLRDDQLTKEMFTGDTTP
jgi:prepilin-type processing-associated H-X9-DG protein/prepilin-type N-terminal cleavage/methylation domain-containing protein